MRLQKSRTPSGKSARGWQGWMLNVGAMLGSICLLMALLTLFFGIKPLIFVSGSMGPQIPMGSLGMAVSTPVSEISPGHIVSVTTSDSTRVTHRVVENTLEGLLLKGDANPVADLELYQVDRADRLFFSIPNLGYVISWLNRPWVFFASGLLCAYVLYVAFVRRNPQNCDDEDNQDKGAGQLGRLRVNAGSSRRAFRRISKVLSVRSMAVLMAMLIAVQLGTASKIETTKAAFAGSATATSSPLAAATIPSVPGPLKCETTGGLLGAATRAEVTWSAPALPRGARYAVRVLLSSGQITYINVDAGTNIVVFRPGLNLLGLLQGQQTFQVKVLVALTTDGLAVAANGSNIGWVSPVGGAPATSVHYNPGVLLLNNFSCV
ncbi:hypothetical protein [Glutamicibacter sp.]|uniref:hypothetical protein n=1 Tax=Glutamicibacter sp. TaxID=1931995 RepID=UPI002B478896|nr:hypothetical protein [Glutamicibacter sp.]HJX80095.1 hypothetical protein [Glutamicibacter sp.]